VTATPSSATDPRAFLPDDPEALLVGRVWVPAELDPHGLAGPHVIAVRGGQIYSLSDFYPTMTDLLEDDGAAARVRSACEQDGQVLASWAEVCQTSVDPNRPTPAEATVPLLLAPCDLQVVKACGVTFAGSMLERVVEEQAGGDPQKAEGFRATIQNVLGDSLARVRPGSPETVELKARLIEAGLWSAYLEVGIGPDAEVFTKCPPMSAVGHGSRIGVLPTSEWNNPEPEIVLAVSSVGVIRGATLGNDVNLRDYEGRSALLLGKAKDQNASCSIGPLVRLFDDSFTIDQIMAESISLRIDGADGFHAESSSPLDQISRSPAELVCQTVGPHHQYPDGFMLFLGTMFTPNQDRDQPGRGFTHHPDDCVQISHPALGRLVNWTTATDQAPPWNYGLRSFTTYLSEKAKSP